jgi:hypothetical protein
MKSENERYTIAVDFDGVIHSYTTPWINAHTIPDPPVDGAITWLFQMIQKFEVIIFSTRCKTPEGTEAMRQWLWTHGEVVWGGGSHGFGLCDIAFSYEKPPALAYIDDRAYRFTGANFPSAQEIHQLRPWNKPGGKPG